MKTKVVVYQDTIAYLFNDDPTVYFDIKMDCDIKNLTSKDIQEKAKLIASNAYQYLIDKNIIPKKHSSKNSYNYIINIIPKKWTL